MFFSLLFPLMLLLIFGTVFSGDSDRQISIYVQNLDVEDGEETALSKAFITALNSTRILKLSKISPNIDAIEYLQRNADPFTPKRLVIIPRGFHNRLINGSVAARINITTSTLEEIITRYVPRNSELEIRKGIEGLKVMSSSNSKQLTRH